MKKIHKLRIQNLSDFLWGKVDTTVGPDCALNEQVPWKLKKEALFYLYSCFLSLFSSTRSYAMLSRGFVPLRATERQSHPMSVWCWWCPTCPPVPHPSLQGTEEIQGKELLPFFCPYHREHLPCRAPRGRMWCAGRTEGEGEGEKGHQD